MSNRLPTVVPRRKLPPAWFAPLRKYHSTPNWKLSTSETSAITISIITCRAGTSSFFSADSITAYSAGVATIRSVLLSLSATTWMLRTMPCAPCAPWAPAAPASAAGAAGAAACCTTTVGGAVSGVAWGWNGGGDTIVPAGVPGASVGACAGVCAAGRPVNACCSSGPTRSARLFCRL